MDNNKFKKELQNRFRFTLQYEIKGYSPDFYQKLVGGIKNRIDDEQLTLFISSIQKIKDLYIYKFYIEISAKGAENMETFDIPNVSKSNYEFRKKEEKWLIIDQMIAESLNFYSDPEIIIDPKTNKRVSFKEHIILLIKKGDIMNIGLTLLGLYPEEWLKDLDIVEKLIAQVMERDLN